MEATGQLYAIGGLVLSAGSGGATDSVIRFDPTSSSWLDRAPLPRANCCFAAARIGDRIYVAGGYEDDSSTPAADLWIYDPVGDSWEAGPSMPTARALAAAVDLGGQLAVIGGRGAGHALLGVIELFDPGASSWQDAGYALPTPREGVAAVYRSGSLVVAGGYPEESVYGTDLVEVRTDSWSLGPVMLLARGQLAWALNSEGMVLAGGWGPSGHTGAAEIWDLAADTWTALPELPTPRAGACAATINDDVYVVGGGAYGGGGGWQSLTVVDVLRR